MGQLWSGHIMADVAESDGLLGDSHQSSGSGMSSGLLALSTSNRQGQARRLDSWYFLPVVDKVVGQACRLSSQRFLLIFSTNYQCIIGMYGSHMEKK